MKWKELISNSVEGTKPPFRSLIKEYRELIEIRTAIKDVKSTHHKNLIRENLSKNIEEKGAEIKDYLKEHIIDMIVEDAFSDIFWRIEE